MTFKRSECNENEERRNATAFIWDSLRNERSLNVEGFITLIKLYINIVITL